MTTAALPRLPHDAERRRVRDTLSGPIAARMVHLVPELAWVPRGRELEAALRDCDLLHRCFVAFRRRRAAFRSLLVDAAGRPVDNDTVPLSCGRTIDQVVAMIVRSAAKRYFRARLDGPRGLSPERLSPPRDAGWAATLNWMVGREKARKAAGRERSKADRLYDAVRRHLLHDWQVPIIPQYVRLTPAEARRLGPRLLRFRDAAEMAAWLEAGEEERWAAFAPPAAAEAPADAPETADEVTEDPGAENVEGFAALPGAPLTSVTRRAEDRRARASEILTDDGRLIRMETVAPLLLRPDLLAALGSPDRDALRRAVPALAGTGAAVLKRLAVDLGLSPAQITALLGRAALTLPAETYGRVFGPGADPRPAAALTARIHAAGLDAQASPAAFAAFAGELFDRFAAPPGAPPGN